MSWISDADESSSAEVAAAFDRDRAALGYVANYTRTFARRPAVLEAWRGLNAAVKASMDPRRYELATLAAARRLGSSYCCLAHGKVLVEQFDGAPEVRALTRGAPGDLDPVDAAVVRLAEKVAGGAVEMSEQDLAELRGLGLTEDEVLDVVLAAAARCFFSTVLDATGTEPDAAYRSLDRQLQESLTVGRPIAGA
ncbi:Alkylhydroperoxidase family enzyme, contains CxxC motif [Blastococcus aurantiacus]|uniref:Alkylhydroperoxidase family enzyme, contains CxxC motif n=1 Tax=Blastococcus aurantiacus TaxID=1550231 RepID=A0A1G7JE92_9ACTN|nr:carboxymuconolactone decarboxylase family protein [Blastococcus aurantiacus]SDF23236.1 Alkylhydroperoxidase family enzyme, contains CxxC motif [Blastococcus aurantiacus]